MLEVRNLMVFFENALALNDCNIHVKEGEIVAVIGSNSAGKTTLMNSVSGLIIEMKIEAKRSGKERIVVMGSIHFRGEDFTHLRPDERAKRGVVLCRERHPIFPDSDVIENLSIANYLKRSPDKKKAMERVFTIFPMLSAHLRRKAGLLSGGEQQMLITGMALMMNPELLLLDEPLLGLSPVAQNILVDAIRKIKKEEGTTILITEQFVRPILPFINRGYVIENGMQVLEGTGDELMDNPEVRSAYFGI